MMYTVKRWARLTLLLPRSSKENTTHAVMFGALVSLHICFYAVTPLLVDAMLLERIKVLPRSGTTFCRECSNLSLSIFGKMYHRMRRTLSLHCSMQTLKNAHPPDRFGIYHF